MPSQALEQLIEHLLRHHGAALRLYAATWSVEPDDCVQQALIRLATTTPLPDAPVPWLYRVVRNEAISRWRSDRRRRKRESLATQCRSRFHSEPPNEIDTSELEQALATLPLEQHEIVVARIWGGLSFEAIAVATDSTSSTVHRRYQQGLEQLKKAFNHQTSR